MAQQALSHDTKTAKAVAGLLDRAARASGSTGPPDQPAFIGFTSTINQPLGQYCGDTKTITLQKGIYANVLEGPLALLLTSRQHSRTLRMYQLRGLATSGDLSYCPDGTHRRWLPDRARAQLLSEHIGTPAACPPTFHPPFRVGQFWVLKGTATAS